MANNFSLANFKLKGNAYISASFVYLIANGIGQGTTLLSNIFFTRYMSQTDYGLYSNYYSYVAILASIVGANLYVGLSNAYIDYREEIHKFRSSVLLLSGLVAALVAVAVLGVSSMFGGSMPFLCWVFALVHAYGFFLVNYYMQAMNMENKYMVKGAFLAIPGVLQALLAGGAVLLCNTYESRIAGSTVGIGFCGLAGALFICKAERPNVSIEYWKYALDISCPAIITSVSFMIMMQCDKVMITSIKNAEATAIYALIYNIGYILYAVLQATNGVWLVWYYNRMKEQQYQTVPIVQRLYLLVMLCLATGLFMISPEMIKILAPSNYWNFEYVIPFIVGSFLMVMYSFHISTAQYYKKTGVVSVIVSMAALFNICLNYICINKYGGLGAAYASVAAYMSIFVLSMIYLKFTNRYYYDEKSFAYFGLAVIVLAFLFSMLNSMDFIRYLVFGGVLCFELLYLYKEKTKFDEVL